MSDDKSSVVRYLHIAEVADEYTIGIFVFGAHERIPLHDHPEMCVLSRVLYGSLDRLSLDLDRRGRTPNDDGFDTYNIMDIDSDDEEEDLNEASASSLRQLFGSQNNSNNNRNNQPDNSNSYDRYNDHNGSSSSFLGALSRGATWFQNSLYNSSSSLSWRMDDDSESHDHYQYYRSQQQKQQERYPEGTKLAFRNDTDVLEAPNVACLYPYEGNLHEFVAGPYGAAVLDVLLPPYDDERKRDCTFYTIREFPSRMDSISSATNPTAIVQSQQQQRERDPCLIVPTGQPENFHCISGKYKDLGETDDYYDQCDED